MPSKQRGARSDKDDHPPGIGRLGTRLLELSENVVYAGIATFLVGTALVCLVLAGKTTWKLVDDFSEQPVLELLDVLLLVFIVVELLFAVRVILGRREVVAEPFLVVGMIASIKEIIVLSVEAAGYVGKGDKFTNAIIEVGVLGGLVLVLSVAAILLRAKETEPREGDQGAREEARKDGEAIKVGQGDPAG